MGCGAHTDCCPLCSLQAATEIKALGDFYKMLQHEPDRAFYG